jgi:CysZ protein
MQMNLLQGMAYNFKGLKLGLKTPRLLILGLLRFVILVVVTVAAAAIILANYQEILNLMWHQPQSPWVVWLWHLVSWLLAFLLLGISVVLSFVIAQVLFSAIIMDIMSQITERKLTGQVVSPSTMGWWSHFFFILRQEMPRAILPILISLLILILGWFTPLGPVLTFLAPIAAAIFLAWDNTDLLPARRLVSYQERFRFLRRHLGFHLGFGLLFLIPILNIVLISFAPVGATLFHLDQAKPAQNSAGSMIKDS